MIDLAQKRLGSKIVYQTDEFFAKANRIIDSKEPIFIPNKFDNHGKWMDGWETRRKRKKGNDYLIIRLGKEGVVSKININTLYFNGNQPEFASIEACYSEKKIPDKKEKWKIILSKKKTKPNYNNIFKIKNKSVFTHIKLNIFPDGGVARLRIYGKIVIDKKFFGKKIINLSALSNGASIIAFNNEHFGKAENILAPGKSKNMGDGWETRRSRGKNFDWIIFKCVAGKINNIQIDTHHFKGNYPDKCSIQASYLSHKINTKSIIQKSNKWKIILNKVKLHAHKKHNFGNKLIKNITVNYVRINIFPDGGIARVRIFGKVK